MTDLDTKGPRLIAAMTLAALLLGACVPQASLLPSAAGVPVPVAAVGAGRTEKTILKLQAQLRANPDDARATVLLAEAYLQRARETADPGWYTRADALLGSVLRRQPENVEALIAAGSLALSRHDFSLALRLGERAAQLNPTIPRIYGVIGDAQVELGRYPEAVATIQRMVDLRPDLASFSRVSHLRELYGDVDGAIAAMQEALQAAGQVSENTEYVRVQLGNLYWLKGRLAEAERIYLQSLELVPNYIQALAGEARLRVSEGRLGEAVTLYRRAADQVPLPELVIPLGETLEAAGRTAEAEREYALVDTIQKLLVANGVKTDLEMALFVADHRHDPARALRLARTAYRDRPGVRGADALAWALYRAGQLPEALRRSSEATRLKTADPMILYHAGMIAYAAGDFRLARSRLSGALALNPHFSPLAAPIAARTMAALGVRR
ncbi:MAG: hypothetical protein DLM71_07745 [Chloroflexi bacterium]|nr:MAG: hypothetical protein DLM71_07745 [Chloroflexota bacterium]